MKDNNKLSQAKSLHIFMFPFIWRKEKVDFKKAIKASKQWAEEKQNYGDNWGWTYNQNVYFYANVNKAINNPAAGIVDSFRYDLGKSDNNIYAIKIKIRGEQREYKLDIYKIGLKLYNTGIGILSFHLINNGDNSEEAILRINDYGRRIFPPYLPLKDSKNSILAESITLIIGSKKFSDDFGDDDDYKNNNPPKVSKTIMSLLGEQFISGTDAPGDKILIEPVIDDRMFVVCWWSNDKKSGDLKGNKAIIDGDFWHKFFFVDHEEPGCQSQTMLLGLLQKHTYDRWLNKGTLYGITRYSFMLLTSDNAPHYLRVHMWTIYYQMVCLVLAQRASILKFSQQISEIVRGNKEEIDYQETQDLHSKYLRFINQLYFREVTAQEQGIEMYDMMANSMAIERDVKRLDEEIEKLHQHIRLKEDKKTNESLYLLTVLGALFVFPSLITSFFGMNIFSGFKMDVLFLLLLFILPVGLALFYIIKMKNDFNISCLLKRVLIIYSVMGIICFILWKAKEVVIWLNLG